MNFLDPIDIANVACQHCGVPRIDSTLGFLEVSQRSEEIGFRYDKLRRAELRANVWRFATRRAALRPIDTNTMILAAALWSSTTTYFQGSLVSDSTGFVWISRIRTNLNNQPETTPAAWEPYFGPMTASLYDSTLAYSKGEVVYTTPGDGTYNTYLSVLSGNSDNPATATAWSATTTYFQNQVVTRSSVAYMSLIDLNLNQDPLTTFFLTWDIGTTYSAAAKVVGSDLIIYQSIAGGNVGNNPTTDNGVHWTNTNVLSPWTRAFVGGTGSLNWLQIGGAAFPFGVALTRPNTSYWPVGAGPVEQSQTNNIYQLPAGYLRIAPQDPQAGGLSYLGFPSNTPAVDWVFDGQYIVTRDTGMMVLRFVADMVDVTQFDDMFCEALGASIAKEVVQPLTQSIEKMVNIIRAYDVAVTKAKTTNGIEIGPTEPELDDWIACRA